MQPIPWESALHNRDRTISRSDYRYMAHRVGGFELSELADPSWSRDTDPGYQARVLDFLVKHRRLLERYHATSKGKKRRHLARRILSALRAAELLSSGLHRQLIERGTRSRVGLCPS